MQPTVAMNNVCVHGQLARVCPVCELTAKRDALLAALSDALEMLQHEYYWITKGMEPMHRKRFDERLAKLRAAAEAKP